MNLTHQCNNGVLSNSYHKNWLYYYNDKISHDLDLSEKRKVNIKYLGKKLKKKVFLNKIKLRNIQVSYDVI